MKNTITSLILFVVLVNCLFGIAYSVDCRVVFCIDANRQECISKGNIWHHKDIPNGVCCDWCQTTCASEQCLYVDRDECQSSGGYYAEPNPDFDVCCARCIRKI